MIRSDFCCFLSAETQNRRIHFCLERAKNRNPAGNCQTLAVPGGGEGMMDVWRPCFDRTQNLMRLSQQERLPILLCRSQLDKFNRFIEVLFYDLFDFVYCHVEKFAALVHKIQSAICKCVM